MARELQAQFAQESKRREAARPTSASPLTQFSTRRRPHPLSNYRCSAARTKRESARDRHAKTAAVPTSHWGWSAKAKTRHNDRPICGCRTSRNEVRCSPGCTARESAAVALSRIVATEVRTEFAPDSPLEGTGFELLVPPAQPRFRGPRLGPKAKIPNHDGTRLRFARDSLVDQSGFEPSVPLTSGSRAKPR
jgi:hypothetical protein